MLPTERATCSPQPPQRVRSPALSALLAPFCLFFSLSSPHELAFSIFHLVRLYRACACPAPLSLLVATLDRHALPGSSDRSAEEREIELLTSDITRVCTARPLHSPLRGPTLTNGPTPSSTSAVVTLSYNPFPPPPPNRHTRFPLPRPPHMSAAPRRTCSAPSPPRSRSSAPPSARSSASIWTVSCAMSSLPHLIDCMRTCAAW